MIISSSCSSSYGHSWRIFTGSFSSVYYLPDRIVCRVELEEKLILAHDLISFPDFPAPEMTPLHLCRWGDGAAPCRLFKALSCSSFTSSSLWSVRSVHFISTAENVSFAAFTVRSLLSDASTYFYNLSWHSLWNLSKLKPCSQCRGLKVMRYLISIWVLFNKFSICT